MAACCIKSTRVRRNDDELKGKCSEQKNSNKIYWAVYIGL